PRKREASITWRKRIEKSAAAFANALRATQQSRRYQLQDSQRLVRVARQLLKTIVRDLSPEIIARHILDFVCFVKNHSGILRQNTAEIVMLQCKVREKQMVVHDNQVGIACTTVHRGHEAVVEVGALLSSAGLAPRIQPGPQIRIVRKERQLRAVTC